MRFLCEHCETKYTIADDKVRNKVLKIRCRKCGEVIVVRDPSLSKKTGGKESKAPASAKKGPPPPPGSVLENKFAQSFKGKVKGVIGKNNGGAPGLFKTVKRSAEIAGKKETELVNWFVAIDGTPVGPVSALKIHAHRQGGRVSDSTMTWKEGMPDWLPLRNCKELVGLLARIDIEEMDVPKEDVGAPKRGLFAEGDSSKPSAGPLKGVAVGVLGERRDSSVDKRIEEMFGPAEGDDNNPTNSAQASNFFDAVDGGGGKELIGDPLTSYAGELSAIHSLSPPQPSQQNRVVLFASVGLFVVALSLLFVVLFMGETAETKTVKEVVEKVVYRDRIVEKPIIRFAEQSEEEEVKTPTKTIGRKVKGRASTDKGAKEMDEKTKALMARLGSSGRSERGPLGNAPTSSRSGRGSSSSASALSASQVKSVVTKNQNRLKSCYERALKTGQVPSDQDIRVNFKIVVGSSGTVTSVKLTGAGSKYTGLSSCLSRAVKRWVFPATKSSSPVEFPFVFTPR